MEARSEGLPLAPGTGIGHRLWSRFWGVGGKESLTPSRIFWFWLPLVAMWLMMAIEHPTVAAVIALSTAVATQWAYLWWYSRAIIRKSEEAREVLSPSKGLP